MMETLHHVHYTTLLVMLRRTAMSMKLSNHTVKIPLHVDEFSLWDSFVIKTYVHLPFRIFVAIFVLAFACVKIVPRLHKG